LNPSNDGYELQFGINRVSFIDDRNINKSAICNKQQKRGTKKFLSDVKKMDEKKLLTHLSKCFGGKFERRRLIFRRDGIDHG
jgi:hypothetical protein